jgi:hypothetical protein
VAIEAGVLVILSRTLADQPCVSRLVLAQRMHPHPHLRRNMAWRRSHAPTLPFESMQGLDVENSPSE